MDLEDAAPSLINFCGANDGHRFKTICIRKNYPAFLSRSEALRDGAQPWKLCSVAPDWDERLSRSPGSSAASDSRGRRMAKKRMSEESDRGLRCVFTGIVLDSHRSTEELRGRKSIAST
ncbi:hypothetical protein EYF80_035114 [Liparis tanakae]|uniref:Uncharacterized protein n=1 Tax=Liparis tanakae TaxID=230148 RepID=A0A4Z2GP83_9TELE|nr:hypothetical protein EYF80_035114 [Liparis tanakae]